MPHQRHSSGSTFEEEFAYSRVVVAGDTAYVSGTTGYDYATMTLPSSLEDQTRNTLENIRSALERAGFAMADIVRVVIYVKDASQQPRVGPILRAYLGDVRPANTTIQAELMHPDMLIEIEATAVRCM